MQAIMHVLELIRKPVLLLLLLPCAAARVAASHLVLSLSASVFSLYLMN